MTTHTKTTKLHIALYIAVMQEMKSHGFEVNEIAERMGFSVQVVSQCLGEFQK